MSGNSNHSKIIIVIGFLLLASLTVIGIILIYGELIKFSESSDTSVERKELVIIGNTLVSLYKLEGAANQLAVKDMNRVKMRYDSLMNNAVAHIDTLKKTTIDQEVVIYLDSVTLLLDKKRSNIWAMFQLLDSVEKRTVFEPVTKTTVLSKKNLDELNRLLKNSTENKEDTSVIKSEGKNFLQRVRDVFSSQKRDSSIVISKSQTESKDFVVVPTLTDTIAEYISEIVLTNNVRNTALTNKLLSRQNVLNRTNERITFLINQIMRDIENREFRTSLQLLKEKEITLKRSSQIVSFIGLSALILTLLFLTLSLRSLTQNQKYRKKLEDSLNRIQYLSKVRERILLTITHDIKSPISSIIGFIELLYKSKLPEKEKYYLKNMQHSSEHILLLIRNLLDYHTLDSNKQTIKLVPFSLWVLLNDIYLSFIPLANNKDIRFLFHSDSLKGKDTNYLCDPYRIRQIVGNLLSNAVKYTPSGGEVALSASLETQNDQSLLVISVKDNGQGISAEDQKIIFEEFRRLDDSKNPVEGSGLGLAITEKLTELLKGSITVNSTLGKGSEFIVSLPVEHASSQLMELSANPIPENSADNNSDKKILFIDDDAIQLNLISEFLKQHGFSPTTCNNSLDALDLIRNNHFDMIFTDIQMPDMNGFDLVERIRMSLLPKYALIPIIALSGSSEMPEAEYIQSGFTGFISKPFSTDELLVAIQKYSKIDVKNNRTEAPKSKGFATLSDFANGDKEAGATIIQSFISNTRQNIVALKEAFRKNDRETIKHLSHKMLPLMQMVSADDAANILGRFERGEISMDKENEIIQLIENQIKEAEKSIKELRVAPSQNQE